MTAGQIGESYDRPKRNGQTAAYCTYCGEEIRGVAYMVQARDVARLTIEPIGSNFLHYDCIAIMFKPSRPE